MKLPAIIAVMMVWWACAIWWHVSLFLGERNDAIQYFREQQLEIEEIRWAKVLRGPFFFSLDPLRYVFRVRAKDDRGRSLVYWVRGGSPLDVRVESPGERPG